MNNLVKLCYFLILVVLVTSCKTRQAPISIINLDKIQGIKQFSNLYYLPKTVIRVKVNVERQVYIRGPYYQFAQSQLGLDNYIQENKQVWKIAAVEFSTYPISDTSNFYLVETSDEHNPLSVSYNKHGFLKSINDFSKGDTDEDETNEDETNQPVDINCIRAELLAFDDDTSFTFNDVPLPKAILAKKSIVEQAALFANTILTLRDDRAAIIVGDGYTNALPEGVTLQTMIRNIDEAEQKYLSMFMGKVSKKTFTFYFDFIPQEPRKTTQSILFRFSEQTGITDNNDMSGMPVVIEIESFEGMKEFEQFKKRQFYLEKVAEKEKVEKGFYFRTPEYGFVRLLFNDKVLMQDNIQIAQFGSILHLPFYYLNGDYTIKFYPELGSIKCISPTESIKIDKKKK